MTMTLPTAKTKPTTDLAKQSILLYGVPKLGKSSFASQFPEGHVLRMRARSQSLGSVQGADLLVGSILGSLQVAAKGDHNFKTLVIDTVDNAFKMCSDYVCVPSMASSTKATWATAKVGLW